MNRLNTVATSKRYQSRQRISSNRRNKSSNSGKNNTSISCVWPLSGPNVKSVCPTNWWRCLVKTYCLETLGMERHKRSLIFIASRAQIPTLPRRVLVRIAPSAKKKKKVLNFWRLLRLLLILGTRVVIVVTSNLLRLSLLPLLRPSESAFEHLKNS